MASGANKLAKGMQAVLTSMVTNKPQADWTAPGKGTKSRWMFLFGTVVMVPDAGLWLPDQQRTISIEDWQVYLELAEAINPSLHPEAEDIVRQYFLLNRSHRPANEFPAKSLSILFCQSKCIAKLNLRNEVTRHDALLAVMLYEQQLQQLFPHSMSPIVFPLRDLTHIVEEEEEEEARMAAVEENSRDTGSVNNNKMNQCSSTLSSGPQSEQAGQQHYQNMSSLLDVSQYLLYSQLPNSCLFFFCSLLSSCPPSPPLGAKEFKKFLRLTYLRTLIPILILFDYLSSVREK